MDVVRYVPNMVKEVTGILLEKDLRLRFPPEELDVLLEPEPDFVEAKFGLLVKPEEMEETITKELTGGKINTREQSSSAQSSSEDEDFNQDYEDDN